MRTLGWLIAGCLIMAIGWAPLGWAFQLAPLTPDGAVPLQSEPLHSELTSPALIMDAGLLAAADRPKNNLDHYKLAQTPAAASEGDAPAAQEGEPDLAAIARKLNNPLGDLWIIFTENTLARYRGSPADGWEWVNTFLFQPVMPIPLTKKWNLVSRPIIPLVSAPKFLAPDGVPEGAYDDYQGCPDNCNSTDPDDVFGSARARTTRKTELGDIVLWQQLSPANPVKLPDGSNLVWGLGWSWMFPTATLSQFGSEKWALGPSALIMRLPGGPQHKFTLGLYQHHHFSFAGDSDADRVSRSQFQPIYWYKLPWGQWQIGGFPLWTFNWEASDDNKFTIHTEMTVANTVRVGKLPIRIGFGASYSVVRPDDYGMRWWLKFYVVPVIPKLITKPIFGG